MPPGVAFQQYGPGKANSMSQLPHLGAKDVVEIPDQESTKKDAESCSKMVSCTSRARAGHRLNQPVAIMAHIVFSTLAASSGSRAVNTGRNWASITHMLRKTTVAVRKP